MAVADINTDKKKYNKMETVLQHINKNFITVNDKDTKKANPVLRHVIDQIIGAMKKKSPLFEVLFTDILYGGSFFDGLKVGKPEEFDIDLRFSLPKLLEVTLETSEHPGFVRIQLKGWANFEKNKIEYERYKGLEKFKDAKNYLLVNEVLKWMESIITQSLNTFQQNCKQYLIPYEGKNVQVSIKKSGPAVTALITYGDIYMDVDLVAVFKLSLDKWPSKPFKSCPENCPKKDFMIVPKSPKGAIDYKDRYWRMSFQEQEKVIISGLNTCKTALRIIKKLRDTQNHKLISSYFIKTVFLHEIDKQKSDFWNTSLSCVLMHMLKTYKTYLENETIPYYWNTRNNLLQHIDKTTIVNFKNFIDRVIKSVDKYVEDNPLIIAEFLSTVEEQAELKKVPFIISTKKSKEQIVNTCNNVTETADLISLLDLNDSDTLPPSCYASLNDSNINDSNNDSIIEETKTQTQTQNIDNSDKIISLLQSLQSSMNILQSDLKFAMTKITHLEFSIQELKTDNVELKSIVQNVTSGDTISSQLNRKVDDQNCRIDELNVNFNSLHDTVHTLHANNETLKNGLKAFVLS